MTRMLTSTTLPTPWRTTKPSTVHALTCPSKRQRPHMFIFATMMLVLLVLLKVASAKEEVVIRYNYDTLTDVRRDHAYMGDDVRFEVTTSDVDSELVIAASLGFVCKLDLGAEENPMVNHNGTYTWKKSCVTENFYYYIRPRVAGLCKFGIVQISDDSSVDGDNGSGDDEFTRSHSKMKSPVGDNTEDGEVKCADGFVKKDGECYESSYKLGLIIVHSILGGVIVGGLVVWLLVSQRRRRSKTKNEESATPKAPPETGASQDALEVAPSTVVASAPTDIVIVGLSGAESSHASNELDEEPRLGQAPNAPAGDVDALSTEPSAPDISELVMKMDTGDPPTYEEATKPS